MKVSTTNAEAAFTILEMMIATVILLFAMTSLYGAFSFGFNVIRVSEEDTRAQQLLVDKLEMTRMYDWSKITNGYLSTNFTESFSIVSGNTNGATYNVTITTAMPTVTETYSNLLRIVTVTVTWDSGKTTQSRSMSTLVAQNGLQTLRP